MCAIRPKCRHWMFHKKRCYSSTFFLQSKKIMGDFIDLALDLLPCLLIIKGNFNNAPEKIGHLDAAGGILLRRNPVTAI